MKKTSIGVLTLFALITGLGSDSWAQKNKPPANSYFSNADQLLTIRKAALLPVTDNVNGIYARFVETKLQELLKATYRFDTVDIKDANPRLTNVDYDKNPDLVRRIAEGAQVDALFVARIQKFPNGIDLSIGMYLRGDGQLILQEVVSNDPRFDEVDIKKRTAELYTRLIKKIPYGGLVLSREGNRVTVDLGARDGLKEGVILSVEQIISVTRHPKFKFLLTSEKEILGKIKLVKVDDTLSFGVILTERERGVIGVNAKIVGLDFVVYEDPTIVGKSAGPQVPQDPVSFGNNPKEWLPEEKPSFGQLGILLGLSSMRNSTSLQSGGSFSSESGLFPQLDINGELWLTPSWIALGGIRQGVLGFDNNQPGSSPSRLNGRTSRYELLGGYRVLLTGDFWGPQLKVLLGYSMFDLFVDTGTPETYTQMSYSGLLLGLSGYLPLTADRQYDLDVTLKRYLLPRLTEKPVSSGSTADPSVTTFSLGGSYRMNSKFRLRMALEFEFYSATFTGTGTRTSSASSSSQSMGSLFGGINYYF